mmetsp:Transcript_73967/g.149598  ORF Transcript_73967/g.149598 Transcript_73967/m.149598 type:complete len:245 (+) Transcript_73967:23-757(+)
MEWLGPEDPRLKDRLTSLLDDVPCLSARSPRHSNGHGGDEHRPWVVPVLPRRREPNLLELPSLMDEPLPEDYKVDQCPSGRHCGNFKCKYFHKPSEQRCKNWPSCDESNCSAIHVDVMQIRMTLIINAADDISCYGPDDIETGICYSRAIIRSFEGISVPAIIRALRHCRFLKILLVPELDSEVGKFYITEIINTLDFVPGLQVIYRDQEAEMARDPVSLPSRVPAVTRESDSDGERPPPDFWC